MDELGDFDLILESLLHHTPLALAVCDATGILRMLSPALQLLLGQPVKSVDEGDWARTYAVYDPEGLALIDDNDLPMARALRGEDMANGLMTVRPPDGGLVYLRCSASPLLDGQAEIVGAVGLIQDVTAEFLAAQQNAQLRDRLVETINHEIRTPLTKIVGYTELMREARADLPPPLRSAADVIWSAANDLVGLVKQVSELGDLETWTRLSLTDQDLTKLSETIATDAEDDARKQRVRLSLDMPKRVVATVDVVHIHKAITVLLGNALTSPPWGPRC